MFLIVLILLVCFVAYANGANDNFKGVATIYGSGTATYRVALTWATLTTAAGSVVSLFIASALLQKFSGKGLVPDSLVGSEYFLVAVSAGAGSTVLLASRLGFPISTTHALLGALAGAGCVAVGPAAIDFGSLSRSFVVPLLFSPLVALLLGALATGLFYTMRQPLRRVGTWCLCAIPRARIGVVPAPGSGPGLSGSAVTISPLGGTAMSSSLMVPPAVGFSVETCIDEISMKGGSRPSSAAVARVRAGGLVDMAHFLSAGFVSFARGMNDTPKLAAPLLLIDWFTPSARMVLIAVVIAIGGLLGARRVAETMSHKITKMDPGQGFATNLTTSILVILASAKGLPVSTTHVSVGSLFGTGMVAGRASARTAVSIVLSWVITLPCAACLGGLTYLAVGALQ